MAHQILEDIHAPQAGESQIGQDQVKGLIFDPLQTALPIGSGLYLVTFRRQDLLEALPHRQNVVDHQNTGVHLLHASPPLGFYTTKSGVCQ